MDRNVLDALILLGLVALWIQVLRSGSRPRQDWSLARVERKLDLILDHLGLQDRDDLADRVARLLVEGRKIEAIEVYREATGAGLGEAKAAVEGLAVGRRPAEGEG